MRGERGGSGFSIGAGDRHNFCFRLDPVALAKEQFHIAYDFDIRRFPPADPPMRLGMGQCPACRPTCRGLIGPVSLLSVTKPDEVSLVLAYSINVNNASRKIKKTTMPNPIVIPKDASMIIVRYIAQFP